MSPHARHPRSSQSNSRLTWQLGARIIPLFFLGSAAMALLAYYLLSRTITRRYQETVRSAAIVSAEFLRGRVAVSGLSPEQVEDLSDASSRTGVRLVLVTVGSSLFDSHGSSAGDGEAVSHTEPFAGNDGKTEFLLEARTPRQAMKDELAYWQRVLTKFCIAATAFGAALAAGFAMVVNRAKRRLIAVVTTIDEKAPPPISTRMAEFAGLHEALFGLHASLADRRSSLSRFEIADFSKPSECEGATLRSASGSVAGSTGAPFHIATDGGGAAGVAPNQTWATIAAAKLGRQIDLRSGPEEEALEAVAAECPELDAVILDGVRQLRWRLRAGRVTAESWQPIGIVAPADPMIAEWTSERISAFDTTTANPADAIRAFSSFLPGPAGIIAVAEKLTQTI